jgi:hypothetical protein
MVRYIKDCMVQLRKTQKATLHCMYLGRFWTWISDQAEMGNEEANTDGISEKHEASSGDIVHDEHNNDKAGEKELPIDEGEQKETALPSLNDYEETLPFTEDENKCLREGVKRFGCKDWFKILGYRKYRFNPYRTAESLKQRAAALGIPRSRK